MQLGEARLDQAVKAAREQRQRLRWVGMTAGSYLLDTVFLVLFWFAGTVASEVPIGYGSAAALIVGGNYAAYASNWNLGFRDPSLTVPLVALGVGVQLALVSWAPQIAFPFLANIFTVFAFGVIWMSLRASVAIWSLTLVASGIALWASAPRLSVPASNSLEITLTWLCFALILGRCLLLGVYANELRAKLAEGRRRLAASLEQIQELVHYDELTKCFNRRTLIARLEQERSRAQRTGMVFSVALMDLDHFKEINDTHGHGVGDEALKAFAVASRSTMRESDVFGRYGGEEFMVILAATTPTFAGAAVERIQVGIASYPWAEIARDLSVTASAGVATYRPGETISQLLNRADAALYEAKDSGRNRVIVKE